MFLPLSRGSINIAEVVHTEHARKQKVMLTLGGRAGQLLIARLVACRLGGLHAKYPWGRY